ncbi:hypothetical protein QO004_003507 [Rhizobium mesoamericanum]|nr:hypothetical protein [Rhizobium mesoamericanum]
MVASGHHGRRSNRLTAIWLKAGVRNTADVPELKKNCPTLGMDSLSDLLPPLDLSAVRVRAVLAGVLARMRVSGGITTRCFSSREPRRKGEKSELVFM